MNDFNHVSFVYTSYCSLDTVVLFLFFIFVLIKLYNKMDSVCSKSRCFGDEYFVKKSSRLSKWLFRVLRRKGFFFFCHSTVIVKMQARVQEFCIVTGSLLQVIFLAGRSILVNYLRSCQKFCIFINLRVTEVKTGYKNEKRIRFLYRTKWTRASFNVFRFYRRS